MCRYLHDNNIKPGSLRPKPPRKSDIPHPRSAYHAHPYPYSSHQASRSTWRRLSTSLRWLTIIIPQSSQSLLIILVKCQYAVRLLLTDKKRVRDTYVRQLFRNLNHKIVINLNYVSACLQKFQFWTTYKSHTELRI